MGHFDTGGFNTFPLSRSRRGRRRGGQTRTGYGRGRRKAWSRETTSLRGEDPRVPRLPRTGVGCRGTEIRSLYNNKGKISGLLTRGFFAYTPSVRLSLLSTFLLLLVLSLRSLGNV